MDFIQTINESGREWILPKRIQIEVAYGCNADCIMCPVHMKSERKKGIMDNALFEKIIDALEPYKGKIEKVDLWGLGEPLLDNALFQKISYAKLKGFRNIAIATNGELLGDEVQNKLLQSGIDTIIFSIDGIKAETHETIRKRLNYVTIVKNAKSMIQKRNMHGYKTKFVFRFIRQALNKSEWELYKNFWSDLISKEHLDVIIGYDMHTWGGEINSKTEYDLEDKKISMMPCHHVWDRLMILRDGQVPLCCADMHHARYSYGNVLLDSPLEIFNNSRIRSIRTLHVQGKKNLMDICKNCTILHSEQAQEIL